MLTITNQSSTEGAQLLRPFAAQSVDQWIAAALARVALDHHADVSEELDCAAFVVELIEGEQEVTK